jgi:pimeloyl-ACP methyl ester carboxylesterase
VKAHVGKYFMNIGLLVSFCVSLALIAILIASSTYFGLASSDNRSTSIGSTGLENVTSSSTNDTGIVLVHGAGGDGSSWSKVIPILTDAGHRVIAAQLPLYSLTDDVDTVKRAIERIGGPTILVGHSYGGEVITNAGYNNPNVTGLVYIAAIAPDEGETGTDLFEQLPEEFLRRFNESVAFDSAGFLYFIPEKVHESFAHDVDPAEANILAAVQKPFNQSITAEKSGPPAWKQLPTWYQVSEDDRLIPPEIQRKYADRMNATTISLKSSHASLVSQPYEIAELILNATMQGRDIIGMDSIPTGH